MSNQPQIRYPVVTFNMVNVINLHSGGYRAEMHNPDNPVRQLQFFYLQKQLCNHWNNNQQTFRRTAHSMFWPEQR